MGTGKLQTKPADRVRSLSVGQFAGRHYSYECSKRNVKKNVLLVVFLTACV